MTHEFPGHPMVAGGLPEPLGDCTRWLAQPATSGLPVVFGKGRIWTNAGTDITAWPCFKGAAERFDFGDLFLSGSIEAVGGELINLPRIMSGEDAAAVVATDVMIDEPLEIRLQLLLTLLPEDADAPVAVLAPVILDTWSHLPKLLSLCWAMNFEGLILKPLGSRYTVGGSEVHLSPEWIKILAQQSAHAVAEPITFA